MAEPKYGNVEDVLNESASILRNAEMEAHGGTDLPESTGESGFPDLSELREMLDEIDVAPIESAFTSPAGSRGRRPYPRGPMIRAHLSMPILGIADISALYRRLMNDPALRAVCGFTTHVPSRPTFSRVFGQLKEMDKLLEERLAETVEKLKEYLPDLGRDVAVDSTMIKTNSNINRSILSDTEAGRGKKYSVQASKGWEWVFGYNAHIVADANHDVPLAVMVTRGNESDMSYLIPLVEGMAPRPGVVIADSGYDSIENSEWLHERKITQVIHKKKPPSGHHTDGCGQTYSKKGTPLCECGIERPFIGPDSGTGERVYGPVSDYELGGKFEGFSGCEVEVRVNPNDDIRLFDGPIPRGSYEWSSTYRKR